MVDTGLLDNNDNIVSACIVIACIDWVHCQYNNNNYDFSSCADKGSRNTSRQNCSNSSMFLFLPMRVHVITIYGKCTEKPLW